MQAHRSIVLLTLAFALTACASIAVTSEILEQRTALALGLAHGQFNISGRVDDGLRTDYEVHTKSGKTYRCYVEGILYYTGRNVSDAICTGTAATNTAPTKSCNALLKAAGKC